LCVRHEPGVGGDLKLLQDDDDDIGVDSDEFDEELEDQERQPPAVKQKTPLRHTTGLSDRAQLRAARMWPRVQDEKCGERTCEAMPRAATHTECVPRKGLAAL